MVEIDTLFHKTQTSPNLFLIVFYQPAKSWKHNEAKFNMDNKAKKNNIIINGEPGHWGTCSPPPHNPTDASK